MLSLAQTLEATLAACGDLIPREDWDSAREEFKAWELEAKIRVLVFGRYDAGKSTLINAMTGATLERGPVPTTQELHDVLWPSGEFLLLDSPGLGAPGGLKDAMVQKAAAWEADLVLIVLGAESDLENGPLWDRIRGFLARGMPLLIVFNEHDSGLFQADAALRDRIAAMVRGRIESFSLDAPKVVGPVFVNALSALTARRARPCKRTLEAASRVPLLETEVQHWVVSSGRQAGLQKLASKVGDHLLAAKDRLEADLGRLEPSRREALDAIQKVKAEFANAFKLKSQEEIESLCTQAVGILGHMERGEGSVAAGRCQDLLAGGLRVLTEVAEDLLRTRLLDLCSEELPGDPLLTHAPRVPVLLDQPMPNLPTPARSVHNSTAQDGGIPGGGLVSTSVAYASKAMREAGVLRSLAQKGLVGKIAGNFVRFAPVASLAFELYSIFGGSGGEGDAEREGARRDLEREVTAEKRARKAIEARVTSAIRNEMQHHAEVLLQAAFRLLQEVREALTSEVKSTDDARSSLMERAKRCEELLVLLQPAQN